MQFTLYSRSYCHLCQDMLDALLLQTPQQPFSVNVIDIDEAGDPACWRATTSWCPCCLPIWTSPSCATTSWTKPKCANCAENKH
jgi:hypothetical protein